MITLLIATTFLFPGGSRALLTTALQEAAGAPVVLVGPGDEKMRAAKFDYSSPADILRETRNTFRVSSSDPARFGFGPAGWPVVALGRRTISRQSGQETRVEEGKWTAIPGAVGWTTVGQLVQRMATPPPMHWFFRRMPITISAVDATEADVRATLLSALGATDKAGELGIQPERMLFESRLVNGYAAMAAAAKEPDLQMGALLVASLLRTISKKDLEELYAAEGTSKSVVAPVGSVLYRAAVAFAKSVMAVGPSVERQVQDVDPSHPVQVEFSNVGRVSVRFTNRQDRPVLTLGREL